MGEQLLYSTDIKGQIVKLPENMQFEMVRKTMELMVHKAFLEKQIGKLERELAGMRFVFRETPAIPFENKKKTQEETPYVSQSDGEFLARVFGKLCSKGVLLIVLFMVIKFAAYCLNVNVLEKVSDYISANFLVLVAVVLTGCGLLSMAEISHSDKKNASTIKKINNEIASYNRNIDQQNVVIRQKNLEVQEEDRKRRMAEERIYQEKRRGVQRSIQASKESYQKVVSDIAQMQQQNVMPKIFFQEGNQLLPVVYYLMQNRITTKLYGSDGALEKARSMLQEKTMLSKVQQIVDNTARTVGQLNLMNNSMRGVQGKLDSLGCQMAHLDVSQKQMNAALSDVCRNSQKAVAEIKNQNKLWRKTHENKSV